MRHYALMILALAGAMMLTGCRDEKKEYNPQSLDDLKGHTICVLEGSMQQDYALKHLRDTSMHFISLGSTTDCMVAVNQGKADGFFASELHAYTDGFKRNHMRLACSVNEIAPPISMCVRKGNDALREDYNAFQDSLERCGELERSVKRWFNPNITDYHNILVIAPTDGKAGSEERVLRVGTSSVSPPCEVMIDNKWSGLEIELLQRYAASRGMGISIDTYEFASLIPALKAGKIDVAANMIAVTEEREKKIDFTHAYTHGVAAILTADPSYKEEKTLGESLKESIYYSLLYENRWKMLVDGLWITLIVSVTSLMLGLVLGGGICWMTMNRRKALRIAGKTYLYLLRNLPMLVLLMLMFYVILAHTGLPTIVIAIIAFGMNSSAYISEIYRTGIQSVDKGQREAGLAMGFTPVQTFWYFIGPQALNKALPVLKNEAVSLLKGTSIVGYISVIDLTKASDMIRNSSFEAFIPLLVVSLVYFFLAWLFTMVIDLLAKRV